MKHLTLILLLVSFALGKYEEVKIGSIDSKYAKVLSKNQLKLIVKEIEVIFENQLGFNVFDYSENGKPINIIFVKESQKKKRLNQYLSQKILKTIKHSPYKS